MDTLKISFRESAEILKAVLPDFKEGIFPLPSVEAVSLEGALRAYQAIDEGTSKKKVVIRFE